MDIFIKVIGYVGVLCFVTSYLWKTRKGIILFSFLARAFFVVHYILLGGYSGAVQNSVGGIASIISARRGKKPFDSKYVPFLIVALTLLCGYFTFDSAKGIISLLPVAAMVLQNTALWLKNQTHIRILTLAGIPLWFAYNFASGSLPAMVSDTLSAISLMTALVRYDLVPLIKNRKNG